MKRKLFILSLVVMFAAVGLLAGCSSSEKASSGDKKDEETYVVKISYENQPGEPVDLAAKEWKRIAEEKSNGRIKVELYPSSQLGSKKDVIEQGYMGGNVIQIADASFLAELGVKDFAILSAPYLTDNFDQLLELTETDWFAGLEDQLQEKGYHIVSTNWIYGSRHLNTTEPIRKPEDLKGLKIRVPNNKLQIKTIELMGGTPTPMSLGDVYPSIAQGVINGMENPIPVIQGSKTYEIAEYISMSGHINMVLQWVAGQKYIESLPDDIVKIIKDSGDEAGLFINAKNEELTKKALDEMQAEGVTIIDDVDIDAFRESVKDIYAELGLEEAYKEVQKALGK